MFEWNLRADSIFLQCRRTTGNVENSKEFSKETKKEGSNTILREELSDRRQIYRAKSR